MPFTPAHSAIVLPFIRQNQKFVSATGLIAGSMAPDFEYFIYMAVNEKNGHTLPGVLYFDLPIVCIISFLFHKVVKINLIDNLPVFLQRRLKPLRDFDFLQYVKKNYVVFLCSAILGSLSHIFWDGFTHSDGYFVKILPFYRGAYVPFEGVNYPLWYALQTISTIVGLTTILFYTIFIEPVNTEIKNPSFVYWLLIILVSTVIVFLRFDFKPWDAALGIFVVSTVSSLCIAFIIAGLIPFRISSYG
jgi:hypothetical protein